MIDTEDRTKHVYVQLHWVLDIDVHSRNIDEGIILFNSTMLHLCILVHNVNHAILDHLLNRLLTPQRNCNDRFYVDTS